MNGLVPTNQFQITYSEGVGDSTYTVYYHVPSTATTGSSLNVTVILYVNTLTGLKMYVQDYGLSAVIVLGNGRVLSGSQNVTTVMSKWLYPGGRWGPLNITIPLTESNTGLGPGKNTRANVTIGLLADTWRGSPVNYFGPEYGQGKAGSVVLEGARKASGGVSILPYLLLTGGAILLVIRVTLLRNKNPNPQ